MGNVCCGGGAPKAEEESFTDIGQVRQFKEDHLDNRSGTRAKRSITRHPQNRAPRVKCIVQPTGGDAGIGSEWSAADPDKWVFKEKIFNGAARFVEKADVEQVQGLIAEGIKRFKSAPGTYLAIMYQTNMVEWPEDKQKYTLLPREGTLGYEPKLVDDGFMTIITASYQPLPPLNELGAGAKDNFTEAFQFRGQQLHRDDNPAVLPGRGEGVGDLPSLKIIGDVDPHDIHQGVVGDCWLLSGISSLAEFDGAVRRLFRKTDGLGEKPRGEELNTYTVTLWDLPTWSEVDVTVDERLVKSHDGRGLLGCTPSHDGELWVCYLEKALAVHCGGWDKIQGGQCTHAWALLTGCRHQYTIRLKESGLYVCYGAYNPNEERWESLTNSPHDGFQGLWPMAWPDVGGGGELNEEVDSEALFEKMCAWDDTNYIMAAGTRAGSDRNKTDGIVDGHAYSVIRCVNDCAGTDQDLIQMRNPWGSGGELDDCEWSDHGPGWDKYPQIFAELNPVFADDGMFWISKESFFKYFGTIYLSACDMSAFLKPDGDGNYAKNYE